MIRFYFLIFVSLNFNIFKVVMNDGFSQIEVRTWHLLFEGLLPVVSNMCELVHWEKPIINEYLLLYNQVGNQWGWSGRMLLTHEELEKILKLPTNEIWLFKTSGLLRGFFEIDRSEKGVAEIVYLGLLPEEIGKGFGKIFIDAATATAASQNNYRVWLHTCEYDHPNALEIYQKAGFMIEKETVEKEFYAVEFLERINKSR